MWKIDSLHHDPLAMDGSSSSFTDSVEESSYILSFKLPIDEILGANQEISLLVRRERGLLVGLADFCVRFLRQSDERRSKCHSTMQSQSKPQECSVSIELLEEALQNTGRKRNNRKRQRRQLTGHPYVLERSDCFCNKDHLYMNIRARIITRKRSLDESSRQQLVSETSVAILQKIFFQPDKTDFLGKDELLGHLACVLLQQKLRLQLPELGAIAFCGDGSILPRKSGTSDAPMASPPAVPFKAPSGSPMTKASLEISLGCLAKHLSLSSDYGISRCTDSSVVLSGLIIPEGITLICGGGYHGKSTLLQAIAVGHYDKIPGDGRELCISLSEAVTVRAEDGRYVNNCNISAFISNLPTPPGVTTPLDTQHFSTRDSSGSTSQAANVSEAIEFGAKALLVDEDISAANFMARDGRMRALVMDESITPLLYRVNGLYNSHRISTVVVVGGVGDWLDVPHQVILLDKYTVSDATAKAQSISRQFSHGHVQYAGRGLVHRLEWDKQGTPKLRRPIDCFSKDFDSDVVISLLDGGRGMVLYKDADEIGIDQENDAMKDADNEKEIDEEEGHIDASKLGQLLGKKQLFATGICAAWILQHAHLQPHACLKELLQQLDSLLDQGGMNTILNQLKETSGENGALASPWSKSRIQMLESVGCLERPRSFEVGQVLTRMRGIRFEELPMQDDGIEEAKRLEEEAKKKALLEMWEKRRTKNRNRFQTNPEQTDT